MKPRFQAEDVVTYVRGHREATVIRLLPRGDRYGFRYSIRIAGDGTAAVSERMLKHPACRLEDCLAGKCEGES